MQTGQNVDKAVDDDQTVDPCCLLPKDDLPCPEVDHNGDQREGDVGVEVAAGLCHIHLEQKLTITS